SRGASKVVAESNYYSDGEDPVVAKDPASQIVNRGNIFTNIRGRRDNVGTAFDPATYYASTPDPASAVPSIVGAYAGPTTRARRRAGEVLRRNVRRVRFGHAGDPRRRRDHQGHHRSERLGRAGELPQPGSRSAHRGRQDPARQRPADRQSGHPAARHTEPRGA